MNKDELTVNIVDYFNERWNERKSDGTKGEKNHLFIKLEKQKE